jgi:hypothetical protein
MAAGTSKSGPDMLKKLSLNVIQFTGKQRADA